MLRSGETDSYLIRAELSGNLVHTMREVLGYYYHICQVVIETEPRFLKKQLSTFSDIKNMVVADVAAV